MPPPAPPSQGGRAAAALATLLLFLDWASYVKGQPADAAAGLAAALRPAAGALASFAKDSGLGAQVAQALPTVLKAAGPLAGGNGGFQTLQSSPSAAHDAADKAAAPVFSGEQSILATVPGGGHSVFGHMGSAPGTPLIAPGSAPVGYQPAAFKAEPLVSSGKVPGGVEASRTSAKELVPGAVAFPGSGPAPKQPLYPTNDEGTGPAHVAGGGIQPLGGGPMGATLGQAGAAGQGLVLGGGSGGGGGAAAAAAQQPATPAGSSLSAPLTPGAGAGAGAGGLPLPAGTTLKGVAPGGLPLTMTLGRRSLLLR